MNSPVLKKVELSLLQPYERNARTHSASQVEQIARSIEEFGFTNPLLIDDQNRIIAGHGRVLAARKLGMDEVLSPLGQGTYGSVWRVRDLSLEREVALTEVEGPRLSPSKLPMPMLPKRAKGASSTVNARAPSGVDAALAILRGRGVPRMRAQHRPEWFANLGRLILDVLRGAPEPMTARAIAVEIMRLAGHDVGNRQAVEIVT